MRATLTHPISGVARAGDRSIVLGLWRLADPKIAVASLAPFVFGAAVAWRETRHIDIGLAATAFFVLFLVEVGKNAVNDLYDFRSGADPAVLPSERTPYSGGKSVLVDRLLTEHDLVIVAWMTFAVAGLIGARIALPDQPWLLVVGGVAALLSVLYSMPPVKLSYRGLGELAVGIVYGPAIVLGSLVWFGAPFAADAVVGSIILGILIAVVLMANELPDERADRLSGKRNLVVRIGKDLAISLIGWLFAITFGIAFAFVAYGRVTLVLGALAGIPSAYVAHTLLRRNFGRPPVAGQTATLVTFIVTGVGMTVGAILS